MTRSLKVTAAALVLSGLASTTALAAGGEAIKIERQPWSFSGLTGQYDQAQLQRGFQVYKEVCASCHSLGRIAFRNLSEPGGPQFPVDAVKALAATYKVKDIPNEEGKVLDRAAIPADRFPPLYANEQEARATHNGALPPDLSLITRARTIEYSGSVFMHPFAMMKDIANGYQEAGTDYLYALLKGYVDPPKEFKLSDGMNYNAAYPGFQIGMANPFAGGDGQVEYKDGTPATVENYARDVAAFLSWTADPHLDARKQMGWQVLIYLLITSVLLFIAKKRIWRDAH